jgi:hypothetical protein
MNRVVALTAASALALTGLTVVAPAASAKGDQIKMRGDCSASSDWAVKVKTKKGKLRTDFWVKNNSVGQEWDYTLTRGEDTPDTGRKSTRPNDDSSTDDRPHTAEVKFRSWVPTGNGTLTFTATSNGETCTVTVP